MNTLLQFTTYKKVVGTNDHPTVISMTDQSIYKEALWPDHIHIHKYTPKGGLNSINMPSQPPRYMKSSCIFVKV